MVTLIFLYPFIIVVTGAAVKNIGHPVELQESLVEKGAFRYLNPDEDDDDYDYICGDDTGYSISNSNNNGLMTEDHPDFFTSGNKSQQYGKNKVKNKVKKHKTTQDFGGGVGVVNNNNDNVLLDLAIGEDAVVNLHNPSQQQQSGHDFGSGKLSTSAAAALTEINSARNALLVTSSSSVRPDTAASHKLSRPLTGHSSSGKSIGGLSSIGTQMSQEKANKILVENIQNCGKFNIHSGKNSCFLFVKPHANTPEFRKFLHTNILLPGVRCISSGTFKADNSYVPGSDEGKGEEGESEGGGGGGSVNGRSLNSRGSSSRPGSKSSALQQQQHLSRSMRPGSSHGGNSRSRPGTGSGSADASQRHQHSSRSLSPLRSHSSSSSTGASALSPGKHVHTAGSLAKAAMLAIPPITLSTQHKEIHECFVKTFHRLQARDLTTEQMAAHRFKMLYKDRFLSCSREILISAEQKAEFNAFYDVSFDHLLATGFIYTAADALVCLELTPENLYQQWQEGITNGMHIKLGKSFSICRMMRHEHDPRAHPNRPSTISIPVYVINGFYPYMQEQYTKTPSASLYYMVLEWNDAAIPWSDFKKYVIGESDPAKAHKVSMRGMLYRDWEDFGLSHQPNLLDNGLFMSHSCFEALYDRFNWLYHPPPSPPVSSLMKSNQLLAVGELGFECDRWNGGLDQRSSLTSRGNSSGHVHAYQSHDSHNNSRGSIASEGISSVIVNSVTSDPHHSVQQGKENGGGGNVYVIPLSQQNLSSHAGGDTTPRPDTADTVDTATTATTATAADTRPGTSETVVSELATGAALMNTLLTVHEELPLPPITKKYLLPPSLTVSVIVIVVAIVSIIAVVVLFISNHCCTCRLQFFLSSFQQYIVFLLSCNGFCCRTVVVVGAGLRAFLAH